MNKCIVMLKVLLYPIQRFRTKHWTYNIFIKKQKAVIFRMLLYNAREKIN